MFTSKAFLLMHNTKLNKFQAHIMNENTATEGAGYKAAATIVYR